MRLRHTLQTAGKLIALMLISATATVADIAFVTNQNSNSVSVIDLNQAKTLFEISTPGNPAGVQVVSELSAVFIVSPDDKSIRRFDLKTGKKTGQLALDGGPIGIAAKGATLFITDWYNARIWQVDGQTMTLTSELATGAAPAGLAVSPDGVWLVCADRDADALSVFHLPSGKFHRKIPVGVRPFAISFDLNGHVFAANVGSNSVTVADPKTGEILTTLEVGTRPYGVAFAAEKIFVTNQYSDTMSVFDHKTFAPLERLETGEYPEGINSFDKGKKIAVANWFSNTLTIFDAKTLETLHEIGTGDGPRAFGQFISEQTP